MRRQQLHKKDYAACSYFFVQQLLVICMKCREMIYFVLDYEWHVKEETIIPSIHRRSKLHNHLPIDIM